MQADARLGHKAAAAFVTATCARVKPGDALLDRPRNRGVVTDLEMEVLELHGTAPVAPPQLVGTAHT